MEPRRPQVQKARLIATQAQVETTPPPALEQSCASGTASLWLVILWSAREPQRIGESAFCEEGRLFLLGRAPSGAGTALGFAAERPPDAGGPVETGSQVLGEALSRSQLEIRAAADRLFVRNVGRCPMWVNGMLTSHAHVGPGDTIHLQQQLLLLCISRPRGFRPLGGYPHARLGAFGAADEDGLVGESYQLWSLRQQLASYGDQDGHVLIIGPSGVGKELVARALHHLAPPKRGPFVAENVATIPPNLGTALLFGNRRNFPNPGMEDRPGLIGQAEGGTLFLDEIGDMSQEAQPLLLRVMEHGGVYTRLGEEAQPRRAQVRFIGATNHPQRLRPELRRRFQHEIHVPGLDERREDIPLLIRHVLALRAQRHPGLPSHFSAGHAHIDPRLVEQLVRHAYSTHVAELAFLVEHAATHGEEPTLLPLHPEILHRRSPRSQSVMTASAQLSPTALPEILPPPAALWPAAEQAQQALDKASGSVARAAAQLGLSRHQLYRIIHRHQLSTKRGLLDLAPAHDT